MKFKQKLPQNVWDGYSSFDVLTCLKFFFRLHPLYFLTQSHCFDVLMYRFIPLSYQIKTPNLWYLLQKILHAKQRNLYVSRRWSFIVISFYLTYLSLQNMWCKITKINDITKQHQNLYAFSYVYSISYSCVYFLFLCLCPIYSVNDICLQYLKNAQRYQF